MSVFQPGHQLSLHNAAPHRIHRVILLTGLDLGWAILRGALEALPGVRIIAEVASIPDAHRATQVHRPDVVITPLTVAGESVAPLLKEVREWSPTTTLVVFAADLMPDEMGPFIQAGVAGYLLWQGLDYATFCHSLAAVLSGTVQISTRTRTCGGIERLHVPSPEGKASDLSTRERAILTHLAAGATLQQVAQAEGISLRTVNRVVAALQARLDAPSAFVLGLRVARLGIGNRSGAVRGSSVPATEPGPAMSWHQHVSLPTAMGEDANVSVSATMRVRAKPSYKGG